MDGPRNFKELETLLRARFNEFTPQQRRVAQRVLSDPEGCAFQTVTQLADASDVNESTVVRFSTSLGLHGYPELAHLCQQRLRERAQMLERFNTLDYLETVEGGSLSRAAAYDQANITRTFANVDEDDWRRAVTTIAAASRVFVIGKRKSFAPANLLAYLLGLVRDEVHQLGTSLVELPDTVRLLGPHDVLVGLSIHRYVRDTLSAFEVANRQGATTIAFTDNPSSPLVPHADLVFYVEVAGVSILRSMTAVVSLIQVLANAVATELGADTRAALQSEEQLLDVFGVYVAPPEEPAEPGSGRLRASRGQQGS